jgi:hypothetical protein
MSRRDPDPRDVPIEAEIGELASVGLLLAPILFLLAVTLWVVS